MKKVATVFIGIMSALIGLTAFSGCGNAGRYDGEKLVLRYWSIFTEADPGYEWHKGIMDGFEQANPDIKIDYVSANFWDYFTKLSTGMMDPSGPDVFIQDICNVKSRAAGGNIMNLSRLIEDASFSAADLNGADLESCKYEGGIYAVPFTLDGRILYCNQDHLNELKTNTAATAKYADLVGTDGNVRPPKTYAELADYSKWLTKMNGGTMERLGFDNNIGNNSFTNYVWAQGGTFFNGQTPVFNTDEGVREGFKTWYDLARINPIASVNAFIDAGGGGTMNTKGLFFTGKVSMMIETNEIPWQNDALSAENRINLAATNVPYTGDNHYNFSGGFTFEINNKIANEEGGKVAEAAFRFIEYFMSDTVQKSMLDELGWMPGRQSIFEEMIAEESDPVKRFVINEMQYRRHFDYIIKYPEWWTPVSERLAKYVSGQMTLDNCLDDIQQFVQNKINSYV